MAGVPTRAPTWASRRALVPAPTLPLVYFAGAHGALALTLAVLTVAPGLPGAFHYHPRMVALVHLVTLGWISGSILGALYIVAPLALGMPLPARRGDALTCAAFWCGTATMVGGFWLGRFGVVGAGGLAVLGALGWVAARAIRGLQAARIPAGVALHVRLAFANVLLAGGAGVAFALNRVFGVVVLDPLAAATAHAHLAVLGWAVMLIFGLSYRLVPMLLPAAMPTGRSLAWSAVLLEVGLIGLAWQLLAGGSRAVWSMVIAAAFVSFAVQARRMVRSRRRRPAEMVGRDWSTWQAHLALLYAGAAIVTGIAVAAVGMRGAWVWIYGGAGLLGYVAQMVVGIQGRLLPLHAWYRALDARNGEPPPVSVHRLPDRRLALAILIAWSVGVPLLVGGIASGARPIVSAGAGALLAATLLQVCHGALIVVRARASS